MCDWLVQEISESRNIRYGKDYIIASKHDILRVPGIQCTDENTNILHKIIVVESSKQLSDDEEEVNALLDFKSPNDRSECQRMNVYEFHASVCWAKNDTLDIFTSSTG